MQETSIRHRNKLATLLVASAALLALGELTNTSPLMLGGSDAEAVIGRPLTPVSYAGVARRTTRRAAYAGAYAHGGYGYSYAPPAVATTAVVTTLPAGCAQATASGVAYYDCGTARYQPYYHGATVVYRPL